MSHLPTERLAALADETPTVEELSHLAGCAPCARERATYQNLAELAVDESARIGAPLTSWSTLSSALEAEGLLGAANVAVTRSPRATRPWMQSAAAVLLVAGGVVTGRYSAGGTPLPGVGSSQIAAHAAPVSSDSAPAFSSVDEARAAQERSQLLYQTATAFLAQRDTSAKGVESTASMRARLAALDQANQAMGAALTEAPYDPVINGYYLTTLGQREATLRQINTTMPASMRVNSY